MWYTRNTKRPSKNMLEKILKFPHIKKRLQFTLPSYSRRESTSGAIYAGVPTVDLGLECSRDDYTKDKKIKISPTKKKKKCQNQNPIITKEIKYRDQIYTP